MVALAHHSVVHLSFPTLLAVYILKAYIFEGDVVLAFLHQLSIYVLVRCLSDTQFRDHIWSKNTCSVGAYPTISLAVATFQQSP